MESYFEVMHVYQHRTSGTLRHKLTRKSHGITHAPTLYLVTVSSNMEDSAKCCLDSDQSAKNIVPLYIHIQSLLLQQINQKLINLNYEYRLETRCIGCDIQLDK